MPNNNQIKETNNEIIDTEGKCNNCGFRIGSHGISESYRCGLITKDQFHMYDKRQIIYNKDKQKYEYKK